MGCSRFNLPEDVVEDILTRLPAKSVIRFKCLNKSFSTLFQNPSFIAKQHRHRSQNNPSLLVKRHQMMSLMSLHPHLTNPPDSYGSGDDLNLHLHLDDMPFPEEYTQYYELNILGNCCINGRICLYERISRYYRSGDDYLFRVVLWNPSIQDFKVVPTPFVDCCPSHVHHVFDGFGFGYDHKSKDYKVIRIASFRDLATHAPRGAYRPRLVEVYSLSTDSWKQIDADFDGSMNDFGNSPFYLNGAYHWPGSTDETHSEAIISFDMTDEVFGIIRLPDWENNVSPMEDSSTEFSVLKSCVAMIVYDESETVTEKFFDIWVMREYGIKESWTKQLVIGSILGIQFPLQFA